MTSFNLGDTPLIEYQFYPGLINQSSNEADYKYLVTVGDGRHLLQSPRIMGVRDVFMSLSLPLSSLLQGRRGVAPCAHESVCFWPLALVTVFTMALVDSGCTTGSGPPCFVTLPWNSLHFLNSSILPCNIQNYLLLNGEALQQDLTFIVFLYLSFSLVS